MPNGVNLVTGLPFQTNQYKSEHSITDPEMKVCFLLLFSLLKKETPARQSAYI